MGLSEYVAVPAPTPMPSWWFQQVCGVEVVGAPEKLAPLSPSTRFSLLYRRGGFQPDPGGQAGLGVPTHPLPDPGVLDLESRA